MKTLVAYGLRVDDSQPVKGTLVKVPDHGEMSYYIQHGSTFDEVTPGSVWEAIEEKE